MGSSGKMALRCFNPQPKMSLRRGVMGKKLQLKIASFDDNIS
jgi:hypothetical protein